jgi:cytochrome c peroxidase
MHDGSERTLEDVVNFYNKGGRANEFLDPLMRDLEAERDYEVARLQDASAALADVKLFGQYQRPIIPLRLGLTRQQKKDLVLFLKALQGDPIDPVVACQAK